MITEEIKCDECGGDFDMSTSEKLYDRRDYFGIYYHREDRAGVLEITSISGLEIAKVRGLRHHLCSYKCLMKKYAKLILPELKKEKQAKKKAGSLGQEKQRAREAE